jgi:hypothetical protein
MRTIALVGMLAALAVPAALAAKPPKPNSNAAKPTISYVLRGTLTAYTPANGATNGSVTIVIKSAVSGTNHVASALKGQTATLVVTSRTSVTLHKGHFTAKDNGVVALRAQKGLASAAGQTATKIIDQGPAHS